MTIILVAIGLIAFFVGMYKYQQKVIHTEGTWFEYIGEPHPNLFSSPLIRLLQDYTKGNEGDHFPAVSHVELTASGRIEKGMFLGLYQYKKVTDTVKIKELEAAYVRKIRKQKQELEFDKKQEREYAMTQFLK